MLTRITYFKCNASGDLTIWGAEYEDDLKLKIGSNESESVEFQLETIEELQAKLDELIKEQEKNGLHLVAKQTFVDIENPTVDELESQIILRYKLMGVTDTILLNNARTEAIKMLKNQNTDEFEEYDLETMQFVVDLNDHDSLKKLLEWQIENFEDLVDRTQENYGIDYGYIDKNEGFVTYEDEGYKSFNSEGLFYRAVAQHEDLRSLLAQFVNMFEDPAFRDEETPCGAWAAFELAMADKQYLRNYIDYCNGLTKYIRSYCDRFNANHDGMHIPNLIEKWGFDKNDELIMEFLAAQTVQRDYQHTDEDISTMLELGLEEEMEDREFAEKMLTAMFKRTQFLIDFYNDSTISNWLIDSFIDSLDMLDIKANKEIITAMFCKLDNGGQIPSLAQFEKEMENSDDGE